MLEWVAYPFSRDLPNPGIELVSPALQVDSLLAELPRKLMCVCVCVCVCVFDFLTLCWSIVYYGLPQWLGSKESTYNA